EFDGYPDKWLSKSADIFEHPDLPLFRVMVAVRRGGPDAEGRAALVQVRSSHALLEGSDSALLTRSANAAHGTMSDRSKTLGVGAKWSARFGAWSMTIMMLALANLFAAKELDWGFKVLAIKRHRLRLLANRLGVGQRSLMFALVAYALNGEGPDKHMAKKVIGAAYTMLDASGMKRTTISSASGRSPPSSRSRRTSSISCAKWTTSCGRSSRRTSPNSRW